MNQIANSIEASSPNEIMELAQSLVDCFLVGNATGVGYTDATMEDVASHLVDWATNNAHEIQGEH